LERVKKARDVAVGLAVTAARAEASTGKGGALSARIVACCAFFEVTPKG
jgi:hypothetical protein